MDTKERFKDEHFIQVGVLGLKQYQGRGLRTDTMSMLGFKDGHYIQERFKDGYYIQERLKDGYYIQVGVQGCIL